MDGCKRDGQWLLTSRLLQLPVKCKTVFTFRTGFLYIQVCQLSWCEYFSKETKLLHIAGIEYCYYHFHLIDFNAFFFLRLCMQGYTRLGAESLASTIYSLLCPLNINFRPSPLHFSAHTWFFLFFILNSPHITENPLQKFCKIGLQNQHRSFMLMIFKGNSCSTEEFFFTTFSQFCRYFTSIFELSMALKHLLLPASYTKFHSSAIRTWYM